MPPVPLPDYQYYNDNGDEVAAEDIFVYGSDDQGGIDEIETSRNERLRRVHTYALKYLAGDRVYIHCARLRGPFINNPWKKENGRHQQDVVTTGKPEFKRRRLMEWDEEKAMMTTPTQTRVTPTAGDSATTMPWARKKQAKRRVVYEEEMETPEEEEQSGGEGDGLIGGGLDIISSSKGQHTTLAATSRETKRKTTVDADSVESQKSTKSKAKPKRRNKAPKTSSRLGASQKIRSATVRNKVDAALHGGNDFGNPRVLRGKSRGAISKLPASTPQPWDNYRQVVAEEKLDLLNPIVDTISEKEFPHETTNVPLDLPLVDVASMIVPSLVPPTVDKAEEITRHIPGENVAPVSDLLFSEPMPPSIFYGSSHGTNTTINIDLASEFSVLRKRDVSEPISKPLNKNGQTISSIGTKPRRAVSVPVVAARKGKSEKRKRKASVTILENIEDTNQCTEGGGGETNDWIPTSSEFRYKKGTGKRVVASIKRDFNGGSGSDSDKNEVIDIDKRNNKTKKPMTQNLRLKKYRTIGSTALSPFGGGQVVTKIIGINSQPSLRKENTSNEGLRNEGAQVISAVINTWVEQSRSDEKGNDPLQEIPGNTSSPENAKSASDIKTKVSSARVPATLYTDKTLEVPFHKPNNPPVPEPIITRTFAARPENKPGIGEPTRPEEVLQEVQTAIVPSAHTQEHVFTAPQLRAQDSQSPWVSTQRRLSAAKKGFISVLDTPISKESSPISIAMFHSRKKTAIALNPQPNNDHTEGSFISPPPPCLPSRILLPKTPVPVGNAPRSYSLPAEECSGPSVVLDTSPSTSITNRHRQAQIDANSAGPSVFSKNNEADLTFSSPMIVRDGNETEYRTSRHNWGNTGCAAIGTEFSPFKTFNTPTKSQFGNFMQEFSPLRYSPDASSAIKELTSRPTTQSGSQSQLGTVPIRLYDGDDPPKDAGTKDLPHLSNDQQQVRPSTWLGLSYTSNTSLFNSSSGTPQPRFSPPSPSSPTRRPSLQPQPISATPQPPITPPPLSPAQSRCPLTPLFQRTSSSQFGQASQQSPGAKLARDMLDLMGGGVWDINDELNKIRGEDMEGPKSSKPVPSAARNGKLGKGKGPSSGSKRPAQWK